MVIVLWVPIAIVLSLSFRPTLSTSPLAGVVFFVAIWGAYLIRSCCCGCSGMITFWTTRVSAIYELYFTAELLLSGRVVPLALLPALGADATALPVPWTFGYPITALVGPITTAQLFVGLAHAAALDPVGVGAGGGRLARRRPPLHGGGRMRRPSRAGGPARLA